ncbi:MAG TPA: hypothetical protein VLT45_32030 [Kofleriaceae bacterium]|nr:hypothetical protein [Kofleriaceae bacterium]
MRRCVVLVVLSGCFGDFAAGGAVTPHAPVAPSGDGGYYRVGAGVGWGNAWGMLQASGDIEAIGDVAAAGGAVRATVFLDSWEGENGVGGLGIVARAFRGAGIGASVRTDELSLGFGFGGVVTHGGDWGMLDSIDLSVSSYTTTFADRPAMRSYGVNLGMSLDPELTFKLLECLGASYCPND